MQTSLTADEIERMRTLVSQHDASTKVGIKEFDLNNPPHVPYVHQEFPCMVYQHAKREQRIVPNAEQLAKATAQGWQKEPFAAEERSEAGEYLDAEDRKEVRAIERKLKRAAAKG